MVWCCSVEVIGDVIRDIGLTSSFGSTQLCLEMWASEI